ncbi:hypothetical protein CAPTEDRAFT_197230 [Capitella teleta]|uniref:BRCT domain-containing protein n=1 Tax=Capitella teleta TaxID=283909 RepID=R7UZD1_CAPTE|nr:hypothetical protein CAPTEDRAFT_197230 [Capitella teleta]|eukprot:ELU09317.1 hypothetical protein CAPTEDRAFT_197230 [Capitella teleta]
MSFIQAPLTSVMPSHRLLLTGFGPGERSEANKQIRALGGKFINANEYRADCTHIVCKNPSRSEKFLSGCLEGKWILTPAYLRDSVQNGAWLPEEAYEWSDSTPHVGSPLLLPNLLNAPKRCRMRVKNRLKLFRDWRVLFLVDDAVRKKVYSKLIECGGGQVVKTVAITRQGVRFTGLVTHAFYDATYEHLASELKKSGVACYEPVFIGECILKVWN